MSDKGMKINITTIQKSSQKWNAVSITQLTIQTLAPIKKISSFRVF